MSAIHSYRSRFLRRALSVIVGAILTTAGACPEDDPTSPGDGLGEYSLTSIAGQALPHTQSFDSSGVTVTETIKSGTIVLNSGETWSFSASVHIVRKQGATTFFDGDQTWSDAGSFTRNGNTFTLNVPGEQSLTGTLSGNTLNVVGNNPEVWAFTRK